MGMVKKNEREFLCECLPISEARRTFPAIVRELEDNGADAAPVFIGPNRRPTVVLLSAARYEMLLDVLDNCVIAIQVRERDANDDGTRVSLDQILTDIGFSREDFEDDGLSFFYHEL